MGQEFEHATGSASHLVSVLGLVFTYRHIDSTRGFYTAEMHLKRFSSGKGFDAV